MLNWKKIKSLGQVKYFNISYGVIIIVPLIVSTLIMINEKFDYQYTIPSSLKNLYFASILYAIAIAIYQYRCPSLIKDYKNLQDYIDKNLEQFKNKAPDLKFHIVLANLNKTTQNETYNEILEIYTALENNTSNTEKIKLKVELDEKLNKVYPSSVQAFLTKQYNDENSKDKFYYWTSGILYFAGSLIVLFLLIIRTVLVLNN